MNANWAIVHFTDIVLSVIEHAREHDTVYMVT